MRIRDRKKGTFRQTRIYFLRIIDIEPNMSQPRTSFDEEKLSELADSIRQHGVIQPITVRREGNGLYRIIAGERRWRAARMAGLKEIPAIIIDADDLKSTELAMVENLQREDLNPVEEAEGYRTLMDTYKLTQEEVAERVGKSRPTVANAIRLLALDPMCLSCCEAEFVYRSCAAFSHCRQKNRDIWPMR